LKPSFIIVLSWVRIENLSPPSLLPSGKALKTLRFTAGHWYSSPGLVVICKLLLRLEYGKVLGNRGTPWPGRATPLFLDKISPDFLGDGSEGEDEIVKATSYVTTL
jgi:hypothetical protein